MKTHILTVWFAALLLLVACQTLNGPQTLQDRIQYAKASVTTSYRTIGSLAQRGRITKAEGKKLITDADTVKTSILVAEASLNGGDIPNAANALDLATRGLVALEAYLKTKDGQ